VAFTVHDFHDLTTLLVQYPEWRAEMRRLVLSDEILDLPAAVRELVEAHKRSEERLSRLEEGQARLEEGQQRLWDKLSRVDGRTLELSYERKAPAYFGRLVRKCRVVTFQELEEELRAVLTDDQVAEVAALDLLIRGQLGSGPDSTGVLLAVEISAVLDRGDVERAARRAEVLRVLGRPVVPVVAGEEGTLGMEELAEQLGVAILHDGQVRLWSEALSRWTSPAS